MNPAVFAILPATLKAFPRHMWLGVDGLVYTGQSTLIDPVQDALAFSWTVPLNEFRQSTDPADYVRPTDDVIIAQWANVKKSAFPPDSLAWQALTTARLSDQSFAQLVGDMAYAAETQIQTVIPGYSNLPADLQLAVLRRYVDNRGVLPSSFINAINLKDFNIQDGDIDELQMLNNGRSVIDQGLDPSILIYPDTAPAPSFPTDYVLEQPVPTFRAVGKPPSLWDAAVRANPSFSADQNESGDNVTFQNNDNQPSLPKSQSTTVLDSGGFDPLGTQATQQALREAAQEAAAAAHAVPLELGSLTNTAKEANETLGRAQADIEKVTSSTSDQIQTGLLVGGGLFLIKVIYDLVTGSKTAKG